MSVFDHVSSRVVLAGTVGTIAGIGLGFYKGHRFVAQTALLTGYSCAVTTTTCVGVERLLAMAIAPFYFTPSPNPATSFNRWNPPMENGPFVMLTHSLAGVASGIVLGASYNGRPGQGVLFFTPLMVMIGLGEAYWYDTKEDFLRTVKEAEAGESTEPPL